MEVSVETLRHWLQELGGAWKRAKLTAQDEEPARVTKLARIRLAVEQLRAGGALVFADELDIHLLPKLGYPWRPKGEQVPGPTPGTKEKRSLAGALEVTPGTIPFRGRDFTPQGASQNFLSVSDCPCLVATAPVRSGPAGGDAD